MREILAIGMLGIFLLAVAAVQPVTASHQKLSLPAIPAVSHKSLFGKLRAGDNNESGNIWYLLGLFFATIATVIAKKAEDKRQETGEYPLGLTALYFVFWLAAYFTFWKGAKNANITSS